MYAVIRSGGKQYRITEGDVLRIEKIAGDVGAEVAFEQVLLVGGSGEPKVGRPTLSGAKVTGKILAQKRQRRGVPFPAEKEGGGGPRGTQHPPHPQPADTPRLLHKKSP